MYYTKYGIKGMDRSQIVQRLLALPATNAKSEKRVETLENVNDLAFRIPTIGYDMRKRHGPLWIDSFLQNFRTKL